MKKIFKALAITAATAAIGTGVAFATGCNGGSGEYVGYYCYANEYNAVYGMVVKVTVKNNIIEKVEDVTNTYGDGKAYTCTYNPVVVDWSKGGPQRDEHNNWIHSTDSVTAYNAEWHSVSDPQGDWTADNKKDWLDYEAYLLQQYEGKSVADVLNIKVYTDENGEPYKQAYNPQFADFDEGNLILTGATQGSGRLLLAVQNALSK